MGTVEHILELRAFLGAHVRELREEQNLTQTQLGLISGLDRSFISRVERGSCSASFDSIVLIADGLGVTPAELFGGVEEN